MPLLNTENQCCSLWVFTFDTYSLTVSIIATISLTTAQIIPEYGFSLTRIFWSVLIRENKRQKIFLFWQILRSTHRYNLIVYTKDRWSILLLRRSPYSVQIQENTDQEKLRIWTLFTQWVPDAYLCPCPATMMELFVQKVEAKSPSLFY